MKIKLEEVNLSFVRGGVGLFSSNTTLKKKNIFWALKNVSFSITENEKVGIIGRNGSGKSTLARLCAGSLFADSGTVFVEGKTQLLSLGVGFKPQLSGLDNIFISASLLGVHPKKIKKMVPEIIAFSELEKFIEEPVRTYSSGMKSKLGFAISTVVCPDILILDETLATGDAAFRIKALKRLKQMVNKSGILLMISHNAKQVTSMCERAIWLDRSKVVMDGPSNVVSKCYTLFCENPSKWLSKNRYPNGSDL